MSFKYVLIIYTCLFNTVLTQEIYPRQDHHKLNVVLFFAKCSDRIPNDDHVLKLLEMHQITRVKNSVPTSHYLHPNGNIVMRNSLNCKELLKNAVTSLVHYCQNALGMRTAVVSVMNQDIKNDVNIEESVIPLQDKARQTDIKSDAIPLSPFKAENMKNVITSPAHKEVFKIRSKRHDPNEEGEKLEEIADVPLGKEDHRPPWDVLDVMAHIKFSFFGKLFENAEKEHLEEEENESEGGMFETMDRGLFDTVKTTLSSLEETPERAFLMVIFGGHFAEIDNMQSPLIQSVKHVIESTDPETTLIALMCSCPEEERENREVPSRRYKYGNMVNIREGEKREQHMNNLNIPVFAKGPSNNLLSQCKELYEIPLTVKAILEEMWPSFGERQKRSLVGGISINRREENQSGSINYKLPTVIIYLCVIILFII